MFLLQVFCWRLFHASPTTCCKSTPHWDCERVKENFTKLIAQHGEQQRLILLYFCAFSDPGLCQCMAWTWTSVAVRVPYRAIFFASCMTWPDWASCSTGHVYGVTNNVLRENSSWNWSAAAESSRCYTQEGAFAWST